MIKWIKSIILKGILSNKWIKLELIHMIHNGEMRHYGWVAEQIKKDRVTVSHPYSNVVDRRVNSLLGWGFESELIDNSVLHSGPGKFYDLTFQEEFEDRACIKRTFVKKSN